MSNLITYITIEDISSGLFRTQIIDLLKMVVNKSDFNFEVIVLNVPWKNKRNKTRLEEYRSELSEFPIKIKYFPLLPPMRYCMKSTLYLVSAILFISCILKFVISRKTKILHCRSYMATLCANIVSNKPVLFDMRSLWVLENISAGNIKNDSLDHRCWSYIERYCLKNSVVSTVVSQWMIEYLSSIVASSDYRLIPIGVDTSNFFYNKNSAEPLKLKLGIGNELVIIYSGSLGLSGVNVKALGDLVEKIVLTKVKFKLVLITNESEKIVNSALKYMPANIDSVVISPNQKDINCWLSIGDIGIHALPRQLDSRSRLGTKVVEYWANGMPVIVNNNVGDAVGYIEEREVGIVLHASDSASAELKEFLVLPNHRLKYKKNCQRLVTEKFDMDLISDKYVQCYLDATGSIL
jgi:glycosyltransferase involved in cell wall biosynthesis